ncbi:hypothetical protein TWF506_007612 [Arthrobotrys conoides]|uniref:F-box domain-containing protein n=1 Tax=Arthrobotrys conoides TaxID=74498 RepID=A0AAN8NPE6_9PEZI
MASLPFCPDEILHNIMLQCDIKSLKALRLTSHTTNSIASEILFYNYKLSLQFSENDIRINDKLLRIARPSCDQISSLLQDDEYRLQQKIPRMTEMEDTLDAMSFLFKNVRELHLDHYLHTNSIWTVKRASSGHGEELRYVIY